MMQKLSRFSELVFSDKRALAFLVFANVLGFFVGLWFYWPQLMNSNPSLWIIIIDSPLSVLMIAIVCALFYFRRKAPESLKCLAGAYLIEYGLWTVAAIALYWKSYVTSPDPLDPFIGVINVFLHLGMVVEGVTLIPQMRPKIKHALIVMAILLVNNFFDYFLGTLTRVPDTYKNILAVESFTVTLALAAVIFILTRGRNRKP
ncbi:MAG: DUF1405 domain-containing protein [Candidatus Aenigmarchaeota archaeon]|nr:DUF1405 domain-containing protein [Candidatus Aenigmarchaeota archaeon]